MAKTITVGMATCGVSAGAEKVLDSLKSLAESHKNTPMHIGTTGCIGMCYREPLVEINDGANRYLYADVTEEKLKSIFDNHVLGNTPVD